MGKLEELPNTFSQIMIVDGAPKIDVAMGTIAKDSEICYPLLIFKHFKT